MKVFISWSGQAELEVAKVLREALRVVSAGSVEPFVSQVDILRGDRGVVVIEDELTNTDYGLVLLSRANKDRPWINYEGGALATLLGRRVATVLLDLRTAEVDTPLAPFQATLFDDRQSVLQLFTEIVQSANPKFPSESIATLFEAEWSKIEASWQPAADAAPPIRSEREMLEEVVNNVRTLTRGQSRLAKAIDATVTVSGLERQARLPQPPPTSFGEHLRNVVRTETHGLIWVESMTIASDTWTVRLDGHPNVTRAEFDAAVSIVRREVPEGRAVVTVSPLSPVDVERGWLPDDTLESIRAEGREAGFEV